MTTSFFYSTRRRGDTALYTPCLRASALKNKIAMKTKKYLPLILFFFAGATLLHGTDVLERTVSVRFDQVPLKQALAEIARQGGFEWSYNASILDESRRVTLVADGWTVREILVYVLGDAYTYKQNGEYLILKRQKKPQQRLGGYVTDRKTGQKMAGVTVYDRKTLRSTTTNKHGYYELPVGDRSEIVVSKLAYRDTVLQVSSQMPRLVKLDLYKDSLPHNSTITLREGMNRMAVRLEEFFVSTKQKLSTRNVRDSLHRRAQVSFLPGLGTNHRLSGSVINDFSINILAGYSRGNRVMEWAGWGNINRENMSGFQTAGLFNVVGGTARGVQNAGWFNFAGGNLAGAQFAGIYNHVADTVRGAQITAITNYAGFGSAGTFQAAGIFNLMPRGQAATQLSGIANHARRISAFQGAGIINTADTLQGCQLSGFINRAGYVKGTQIGLINFAREIDGAQLGLINLSRRGGYIALEASANDVFLANTSFKSGVSGLYTIFTASIDPESPENNRFWAYGIGLGSRARLSRWSSLTFDLISRHVSEGNHDNRWQEWIQLAAALDINFGKHFSIMGGPSGNLFVADPAITETGGIRARVVGRDWLGPDNNADGKLSAWAGWTAGVRIRF